MSSAALAREILTRSDFQAVRAGKDPLIGTGNADTEGSVLAARLVRTASTCWTRFSL